MIRSRFSRVAGRAFLLRRLFALVLMLTALTSCAYYNTFYLARKYYFQGIDEQKKDTTGRLSPTASERYDRSIKQAMKVLQRYPDSKWVDDALFLIGKAYFGREEYGNARRYLQQLLDQHPQSENALEARFWMARTWAAETDYARASDEFREILAAGPDARWADEVFFAMGEVEFNRENYAAAVDVYRQLLAQYPTGARSVDAMVRIGDADFQRRQYPEAQKSYEQAMAREEEARGRFDLRLKIGQCMEKREQFDQALDLYRQTAIELVPSVSKYNQIIADPVDGEGNDPNNPDDPGNNNNNGTNNGTASGNLNNTNDPNAPGGANYANAQNQSQFQQSTLGDQNRRAAAEAIAANPLAVQLPRVLLRQGLCLSARGDQKGAVSIFRVIITAFPRTSEAGEAQYRIGYIQEVELQDYEAARKSYDDVKTQGSSLFTEQARRRSDSLARLVALAAADTAQGAAGRKTREAEAERAFLGAELYMFQQDKPEKALEQYTLVEQDFPGSSFAPRAALARAWILTNTMQDTTAGAGIYRDIVEKYPGTDAWRMAYTIVNGEPPVEEVKAPPIAEAGASPDSLVAPGIPASPVMPISPVMLGAGGGNPDSAQVVPPSPDMPPTPIPVMTSTVPPDSAGRAAAAATATPAPTAPPASPQPPSADSLMAALARGGSLHPRGSSAAPLNAITPGTPHRSASRVLLKESPGLPKAYTDWQRWLRSPESRRVMPGRPTPSGGGGGRP